MSQTGPAGLLRAAVAAEPARPLVTFYDDATGERVELSARTFDNWVAKTANLLVDGLDAQPGTRVVLALPPHWQTVAWLFACWSAGLVTVPLDWPEPVDPDAWPEPVDPDAEKAPLADLIAAAVEPAGTGAPYILATTEDGLAALDRATLQVAEEVVGLSLHSLGAPLGDCPQGVVDYAAEVRSYGDRFVPVVRVDPGELAAVMMTSTFTGADLVERAREFAAGARLEAGARVLTAMSCATPDGLFAGVLGPIAAGGSVIICRNLAKNQLDRRVSLEHVTAVAGVSGWNEPSGSIHRLV